jgi:hypothetical protein
VSPPVYLLDQRGVPDCSKRADIYSIGAEVRARPMLGNPRGKVIVALGPSVLMDGTTPGTDAYNLDVYRAAQIRGALLGLTVWPGDGPSSWHSEAIDITKPGMVRAILNLRIKHFPWADGTIIDPYCPLTWELPQLAPLDGAWNACLAGIAYGLHLWRPSHLVIAQNTNITSTMVVTDGEFWERTPEYNGSSMLAHSQQVAAFLGTSATSQPTFIAQVRNPETQAQSYLDVVAAWCADPGKILGAPGSLPPFYLCLGEDATAQGAA